MQIFDFHCFLEFLWNILTNNSSTGCRTDLGLGPVVYILILYNTKSLDNTLNSCVEVLI